MSSIRLAGCLAAWAIPVMAQAPVARLSLGAGSATDLRGVRSGAYVIAPSLSLSGSNATVGIRGRGIHFTGEGWSLGGGGSINGRIPFGRRLGLLIGAEGDAVYASYGATYLQAEATPALELRLGSVELWGGVHGALARSSIPQVTVPPLGLPGASSPIVTERSAAGPAFGAALTIATSATGEGVRLTYREEHGRPDGVPVVDRVLGGAVARGAVALSGALGVREARGEQRGFGGGQMLLTVAHGIAIFAAAESYPSNRLTGALGGRSFSAGVTFSAGLRRGAAPRPSGARPPAAALTRVSIEARDARTVEVAGDWNGWRPVPLRRAENGVWYGDLSIPPGEYRYAFRLDGKIWEVPKGVAAVNDGFGGRSAWLSVRESGRKSKQSAIKETP